MDHQEGAVYTFGQNAHGELALGDTEERLIPTRVGFPADTRAVDVACGNEITAILSSVGEVHISGYCGSKESWKRDHNSQTSTLQHLDLLRDQKIEKIIAGNGSEHLALVTDSGELFTFGNNFVGQLGTGSCSPIYTAVNVQELQPARTLYVACSYSHTMVLTDEDEVWQFGLGDSLHQRGNDDNFNYRPEKLTFFSKRHVVTVACGLSHAVVSLAYGGVYAFGTNDFGQLGNNSSKPSSVPTLVAAPLDNEIVVQISCGYYHSLALTADGRVASFGRGDYGQLGTGNKVNQSEPHWVSLGDKVIKQVACGAYHSIIVGQSGGVYPFGRNNHGQLGIGNTVDATTPQVIQALSTVRIDKVAAGFYHTACLQRSYSAGDSTPSRSLKCDFATLVNNPQCSDVCFIVQGQECYAHRCILAARCEPLQKMVTGPMIESRSSNIVIPNCSFLVFLSFMEFLYTDEVARLSEEGTDLSFILELLSLADQFLVKRLKTICCQTLQHNITVQNALHLVQVAEEGNNRELRKSCIDFILLNFKDLVQQDYFSVLPLQLQRRLFSEAWQRGMTIENVMSNLE